jgi:hypothetical protein
MTSNDEMYCNVIFTLQECAAISVALVDYGSKKLRVKVPPEVRDSSFIEDFNLLKKSRKLEIYQDRFEEMMRGTHKAMLDARLEEMGHKREEKGEV